MRRSNLHSNYAVGAGAWLGRAWCALLRTEMRAVRGLIEHGTPSVLVHSLKWTVRLIVLGLLTYCWVIVALFLVAAVVLAAILGRAQLPPPAKKPSEWRSGWFGFGIYNESGWRLDPHDPLDPNREP